MGGLSEWSSLLEDEAAQVRAGTVRPLLDRRPAGRFLLLDTESPSGAGNRAAAYDKLLDRKVMLQFLDREGAASTLGEAAAMARLSHPNLIKVHDVGELDGRAFVATELLEGKTLREWRQRPRSAREIAEVIAAAARGVAAGHAQGIVHGALSAESIVLEGPRVVVAGLGTPGANARADVRALGTVLYEMVHGSPPGPQPALAPRARALARLHRLALSLLAEDSSQASAEGLAQALAAPWGRARTVAIAAGAVVSVAAIFIVGSFLLGSPVRRCQAGVGLIDGLWNDGRRAELARRFAAIPAMTARWAGFTRAVDEYAQRWRAAHAEVCRTGYGRRRVSGELFDRRMLCLTRRRLELEALLAGVAAATPEQLTSDTALTPAEATRCATIDRPESKPPPSDPRSRATLDHVEELLARAQAQQRLGASKAAAATATEAVALARTVRHDPTLARALNLHGRCLIATGVATTSGVSGFELAARVLEEAYMVADRGEDDSNRLVAAGLLIEAERSRSRYPVADRWVEHAEALLARQGMPPTEASEVQTYIGYLRRGEERPQEAANAYRKALELAKKAIPPDRRGPAASVPPGRADRPADRLFPQIARDQPLCAGRRQPRGRVRREHPRRDADSPVEHPRRGLPDVPQGEGHPR
jgi:tetratricopeptide (TPR) repeat protein